MAKDVKIPDIGGEEGVEVIDVLVAAGDEVEKEDSLITLESDKAAMDVPAPFAGTVKSLKIKNGDKVSEGDVIMSVEESGESAESDESAGDAGDDKATTDESGKKGEATREDQQRKSPESSSGDKAQEEKRKSGEEAGGERQPVKIPDIGGEEGVEVIDVLVAEGDSVEKEDSLITLESDKAAMDVPAPFAGTVKTLTVKTGDKVSEGDEILVMETAGEKDKASATAGKSGSEPAQQTGVEEQARQAEQRERASVSDTPDTSKAAPSPAPAESAPDSATQVKAHAGPSVRKFARELGVDLATVDGSGRKGRITRNDVKLHVKSALRSGAGGGGLPAVPEVDYSRFGEIETKPLSRIKRISGPRLQAAWVNAPHVTQHDEADITALEKVRKGLNEQRGEDEAKLTALAFLVRASVLALKAYPTLNSSLDAAGENLIERKFFNIGFAVDTPGGLLVPVIRGADKLSLKETAAEIGRLAEAARDGKLKRNEMEGGCFSISSLGGIGGTAFTPIVNAPEVAILGASRAEMKPRWDGAQFQPRLMLPLSLSYDHRIVDGALAARVTRHLAETLETLRGFVS